MEFNDRLGGSLEEGRYRLLIDGITDYAIYMLDPRGGDELEPRSHAVQRIRGRGGRVPREWGRRRVSPWLITSSTRGSR